jgi:hypothetical protein
MVNEVLPKLRASCRFDRELQALAPSAMIVSVGFHALTFNRCSIEPVQGRS